LVSKPLKTHAVRIETKWSFLTNFNVFNLTNKIIRNNSKHLFCNILSHLKNPWVSSSNPRSHVSWIDSSRTLLVWSSTLYYQSTTNVLHQTSKFQLESIIGMNFRSTSRYDNLYLVRALLVQLSLITKLSVQVNYSK
jgi:hypothetical protein